VVASLLIENLLYHTVKHAFNKYSHCKEVTLCGSKSAD
jgi:hypothetical protein